MRAVWDYLADEFTAWDVIEIALCPKEQPALT
jgi:hypothetical protein